LKHMMPYEKSNELLRIQLEEIPKKLEAQEVANISSNGEVYDFCEKAHESGACLPESFGLSEDQVKYMGVYTRQKRNPFQ